jgi:hypothetical protein
MWRLLIQGEARYLQATLLRRTRLKPVDGVRGYESLNEAETRLNVTSTRPHSPKRATYLPRSLQMVSSAH